MRFPSFRSSALRRLLLGCIVLLLLTSCEERSPESLSVPASPPEPPSLTPLTNLPVPPASWVLEEDASLYRTLYHSTGNAASLEAFRITALGDDAEDAAQEEIDDRLITAVASDL